MPAIPAIKLLVAVTDNGWFDALRQQSELDEVNFWRPYPQNFHALEPGELFLFKLRRPHNHIAGGGIFAHAAALPCSLAWKAFGVMNGAQSLLDLRKLIAPHRKSNPDDPSDFQIGCRILTQPFFFDESDWMPVPNSWPTNTLTKIYRTSDPEGLKLWTDITDRLQHANLPSMDETIARSSGTPYLIRSRGGQGTFRVKVMDTYDRRCAVTRERTLPALEAAHIFPHAKGGTHEPSNGLLLRSDIHNLFDSGYVTVTDDLRFEVSDRIREEYKNGRAYYDLRGKYINAPRTPSTQPDREALRWHNENCFLG